MVSHFDTSPDQEYFQAVEQAFIALRGTPFEMSPDDYGVARQWRRDGVPVELVAEVLADAIRRLEAQDAEVPLRLAYYRRQVGAAWKERRRLQAPGDALDLPGLDITGRLDALARALPGAVWTQGAPDRVRALVEQASDAESIEDALSALDRELLAAAAESLDADGRRELDDQLTLALDRLAARLPGGASPAARSRLRDELLRRHFDLPVLSLFSLQAAAGERPSEPPRTDMARDSP